jgi:hypothetical protein
VCELHVAVFSATKRLGLSWINPRSTINPPASPSDRPRVYLPAPRSLFVSLNLITASESG